MKKFICLLIVFNILFSFVGCGDADTTDGSSEYTKDSLIIDYNSLEYEVITKNNEKFLNIYKKDILLQTIKYDVSQNTTKADYYFEDINFDDIKELILPASSPAYGMWFYTYKWDNEKNKFVKFKSIDEMTNPVIDYENKQILYHSSSEQAVSYAKSEYNKKGELVTIATLFWQPAYLRADTTEENKDEIYVSEEKNGKKREFYVPSNPDFDLEPDFNCDEFKEYTKEDSYWDLKSTKWDDYFFQ